LNKLLTLVSGLLLLVVFIGVGVWRTSVRTRQGAEHFVGDVRYIRVGESTFSDANTLSTKYASYFKRSTDSCNQVSCNLEFYFDNKWLHKFHLAPSTFLSCQIYVTGGKVTWLELAMSSDAGSKVFVEEFPSGRVPSFKSGGKMTTEAPWHPILISVQFSPDASRSQKEGALGFN
jgi:hypothetical protein